MMLAEIFKALGDPVRLRLFQLLANRDELCVCHLTEALDLPQSTVSRHLGVLRHAGLVQTRREGKWMHYCLTGGMASKLAVLIAEFSADESFQKDKERLRQTLE
ncbi:MAG: metalloregulator ArsR/SmtB family transcription factor [Mariprofundaceae bacterium]|nr:metalloregulator ArsR/SmtB family transcription factor [Mariprofundaceae bacterium]